jgi:hypothetical protein
MKKLNLPRKTNIIIGLFVVAIFIFVIFINTKSFSPTTTPPGQKSAVVFPEVTTYINNPNQFIWQIDSLNLPEEINIVSIKQNTQAETILKNLKEKLGFKGTSETIPNSPLIFYNNLLESTNIYLNKDENFIQFSLNLLEKPLPKNTASKPLDSINQDTLDLLQKTLNLSSSVSITKNSTNYQKIIGPRYVNTTSDEADLVRSTYSYSINSLPVLFPKGNSIETTHSLSGKLIKLSLNLPFESPKQESLKKVKTIKEIKATPVSQFVTIILSGNEQFTLSDQEIDIDTAIINNGFLGYLYNHTTTTISPYIFLTGLTENEQFGEIEILLTIPAIE